MNTTGIQNYLSNVFHPIYTWDTIASNFTPKLEMSNIDTYSGNTITVFSASVSDSASNVYVGREAGNSYTTTRACINVTALGYGAANNISNDSNSVYIGWYAGASGSNSSNVISIGKSSGGNGTNNIFLGTSTGTIGQSNILIGHFIAPSNVSNQIRIGYSNQIPIAADLSVNWVGLGGITSPTNLPLASIDISGSTRIQGNVGINIDPGTRTLDVNGNFRARDASLNILDFSNGLTRSSLGYVSVQSNVVAGVGSTTIAQLRRGIVQVSAVDQANSANRAAYIFFAYTNSNTSTLASNIGGDTDIAISSTNIQISNATSTKTYDYSVTYFPLP